jgi:DNA-3-methyladenine glycosylase II
VRSIIGQQVSVHAARAIYGRLTDRFGGRPPTPAEILADDPDELRAAAGMSRAKTAFLRSLAEHVVRGELELERLDDLSNEDVMAELVAVKGIGVWTAHMFLMFQLERPDVLPVGDLGIRRAIERLYDLPELPSPARMEEIAEPWRPYRTLACRYLWRSLANEPG